MVLGAALAVYGLLLRPVLYETLWFAALYEYIALLAVLVLALLFVVDLLRRDAAGPEAREPESTEWARHRQVLESKDDPRSALASAMRRRFVDYGEWKPLWSYLMGLLYRNGASVEGMHAALRPLRAGAVSSAALRFLDRSALRRLGRAAALEEALRRADDVLPSTPSATPLVTEDGLRTAAAPFVETGADVERLVIALIVAHCQGGLDVQSAMDRWLHLLDAPQRASGRSCSPGPAPTPGSARGASAPGSWTTPRQCSFGAAPRAADNPDPASLAQAVAAAGARD